MEWITVHPNGADSKGQPIPVKEGQSKKEAINEFLSKHQKGVKEDNEKSIDELKSKAKSQRVDIDKTIKAKTIEQAAKKFAELLEKNGYEWASEEVLAMVEGGYYNNSNATEHGLEKGKVNSPKTRDWTYYWAIEESTDNTYYAWFIDKDGSNK